MCSGCLGGAPRPASNVATLCSRDPAVVVEAMAVDDLMNIKVASFRSSDSGNIAPSTPSAVTSIQGTTAKPKPSFGNSLWENTACPALPAFTPCEEASVT